MLITLTVRTVMWYWLDVAGLFFILHYLKHSTQYLCHIDYPHLKCSTKDTLAILTLCV